MKLTDNTGSAWVSVFDKIAKMIVGIDAKSIKEMKEQGNEAQVSDMFKEAHNKEYKIGIMAKQDSYQNQRDQQAQQRTRLQIVTLQPVDYRVESNDLLKQLEQFSHIPVEEKMEF